MGALTAWLSFLINYQIRPRYVGTCNVHAYCSPSPCDLYSRLILPQMQGAPQPQSSSNHDNLISTFTLAIDGFNLAKDILSGTPAKAVVGSVGIILARIRVRFGPLQSFTSTLRHKQDSLQNEDFLRIGTKCAYICSELGKSAGGKNPSSFSQPISEAIDRLEKWASHISFWTLLMSPQWQDC